MKVLCCPLGSSFWLFLPNSCLMWFGAATRAPVSPPICQLAAKGARKSSRCKFFLDATTLASQIFHNRIGILPDRSLLI